MARQYKAFISYRHLPLDMDVAKKVHRAIEHFVLPRALRKDGCRRLGYVFRDEDELPISGELTENIRLALENSEYLIVICTPETSKSTWVLKEIDTFLSLRDHSHVLLVLADGTPAESFPRALTELRDESGAVIGEYEPLAANLVAPTPYARNRRFKTEILRILAALVGCSFDELYQRERRYQRRRTGLLLSLAALVAAVFIGVLLNRNAEISRQLRQSRINESESLAALSENAFRKGDVTQALNYALDALPGTGGERPYVAAAEAALWKTLRPYGSSIFAFSSSIGQETAIVGMVASGDGQKVYTGDPYAKIRAFDLNNGSCLWSFSPESGRRIDGAQTTGAGDRLLVVYADDGCCLLSGEDGSVLWERDDLDAFLPPRDCGSFLAVGRDDPQDLRLVDAEEGKTLIHFPLHAYGTDGIRLAAISPDESRGAVMLYDDDSTLLLLDLSSGKIVKLAAEIPSEIGSTYMIRFSERNDLAIARVPRNDQAEIYVFSCREGWREQKTILTGYQVRYSDDFSLSINVPLFAWSGDDIVLGMQTAFRSFDAKSGELNWSIDLPGNLCAAEVYDNDSFGLVLDNGRVCFSSGGYLFASSSATSFNCSFEVDRALICGQRYLYSSTLVIPREDENRIAVIRALQHDDWEMIAASEEDFPAGAGPIFSPSGKKLVLFNSDYVTLSGTAFDLEEGSSFPFSIELPPRYNETTYKGYFFTADRYSGTDGHFSLTEDFVLMNGPVLFRLRENSVDTLPAVEGRERPYDGVYCSTTDAAGHIVTVTVDGGEGILFRWLDGEAQDCLPLPEEASSAVCGGVGADGRVLLLSDDADGNGVCRVYSPVSGSCSPLAETEGEREVLCFGLQKPRLALVDEAGPALFELESGALLRRFDSELPADSLVRLCFVRDDSLLLAFSKQGDVLIFDAESGALLKRVGFAPLGLTLSKTSRISVREAPERNLLMIFCYEDIYTESACAFLDAESFELFDLYCSPIGCDPVSGRLLLSRYKDGLYSAPLYTLEELTEQAMQRIGRTD